MAVTRGASKQIEKELTKDNPIEQLAMYGYFHEYIPPCFNTESLNEKVDSVFNYIQSLTCCH